MHQLATDGFGIQVEALPAGIPPRGELHHVKAHPPELERRLLAMSSF